MQPLHDGVLVPCIAHFANMEMILTQTISHLSISFLQTTTLKTSTNIRMQTSLQVCWPEKGLELSVLNPFAELFTPFNYWGFIVGTFSNVASIIFGEKDSHSLPSLHESGSFPITFRGCTQRSKYGSRQNECPFELFLDLRTWSPYLQLYVKVRSFWINMYAYKSKGIFILAILQKEDQFEITWIHVRGTIQFSVCAE